MGGAEFAADPPVTTSTMALRTIGENGFCTDPFFPPWLPRGYREVGAIGAGRRCLSEGLVSKEEIGAPEEIRTPNLLIRSQMLHCKIMHPDRES